MSLNKFYYIVSIAVFFSPLMTMAAEDADSSKSFSSGITSTDSALSVNEPMYIVFGKDDDTKGRFQFSFKYRIFDEDSSIVRNLPWLERLHFTYTQTSLWNLSADSLPFEDSSYRPGLIWDIFLQKRAYLPTFIRSGYEHESNGQAGDLSRSIDTLVFWPFWAGRWHGHDWLVGPKLFAYFSKGSENDDIANYRGHADFVLNYGLEDSWLLSTTLRRGNNNYTTIQIDLSYPTRKRFFYRTGGYIYMQIFQGYGESMLTYNEKINAQFRFGFAIVR